MSLRRNSQKMLLLQNYESKRRFQMSVRLSAYVIRVFTSDSDSRYDAFGYV